MFENFSFLTKINIKNNFIHRILPQFVKIIKSLKIKFIVESTHHNPTHTLMFWTNLKVRKCLQTEYNRK